MPPKIHDKTIRELCAEAGINVDTYYDRRNRGMSHEQALAYKRPTLLRELCKEAGISYYLYHKRREQGMSHEEALAPRQQKHEKTIEQPCEEAGFTRRAYYDRLKRGMISDEALRLGKYENAQPDGARRRLLPLGMTQKDMTELCRAAGISLPTYYSRRRNGMSHEDALTMPRLKDKSNRAGCSQKGLQALCNEAGIKLRTYYDRRSRGMTHEEALHKKRG